MRPEYIFETSWEVCNKVGGIYTVLSTRAATLQQTNKDKIIFFGPDIWQDKENPYFTESASLLKGWKKAAAEKGLQLRIGRWNIPGKPIAVLVDFRPFFLQKNEIYGHVWERFGVNSIAAYGDYDESSMFGYAAGAAMVSYYKYHNLSKNNLTVAHFNEWMTSFGLYYVKEYEPRIATLFTTHATSIGRSIAGNKKPLYDYLHEYNGDQMAEELNMVSKHSTEKRAAHLADCFTTVSTITDRECEQLLEKKANVVTPNGFEADFVPAGKLFTEKRKQARDKIRAVTEAIIGQKVSPDALFVATSGRYEYKNKGIDVFIEALKRLNDKQYLNREIVAFIAVPAYISGPRRSLQEALRNHTTVDSWNKFTTHKLYDYQHDPVISALRWFHLLNQPENKVKVIFVPSYICENGGIFNCPYYDFLIGFDITVFPSYYEPWGYTPLESIAFHIPTITTDLSGFGQWVSEYSTSIENGIGVIHRSDYNTHEVVEKIADMLMQYAGMKAKQHEQISKKAADISKKALWKYFIQYYYKAYEIALLKKQM